MEPKKFVFALWKARRADDFDHYLTATSTNVFRGVSSARGLNEAKYKIAAKYESEIEKGGYDRIMICFGLGQQSTSCLAQLSFYENRIEKYGY